MPSTSPEPWLRGLSRDLPAVLSAILDALELSTEDVAHWCGDLTEAEIHARPSGLPSVAFHLRHIARSIDRLLTHAEGRQLDPSQLAILKSEMDSDCSPQSIHPLRQPKIISASDEEMRVIRHD